MEYKIYRSDELTHHGIKGMRWGIRRFQRKDGSLTPAGEKRLKAERKALSKEAAILKNRKATQAKIDKLAAKRKSIEDEKKALDEANNPSKTSTKAKSSADAQPVKKSIKDMSDIELMDAINRARLEDTYKQLRPEPQPKVKGAFMKQMVNDVVKPALINSGRKALEASMNQLIEKVTNGKVDPNSIEALKKTYEKLDYKQKIDKIVNPDKYLSEEDKNKRQQREYNAEDRAAKKAADEAAKKSADEAAKKSADEAARKANESISEQYYNSTYSQRGGEKTTVGSSEARGQTVYNSSNSSTVTSLTTKSNVSNGKSSVSGLLDGPVTVRKTDDNKYATFDEDGRFIGYWSDDMGDVNGII